VEDFWFILKTSLLDTKRCGGLPKTINEDRRPGSRMARLMRPLIRNVHVFKIWKALDLVKWSEAKSAYNEAAGTSGVIAEMLLVTEEGITMLRHLAEKFFSDGMTPRN
jgi:hypothetical protein